MALTILFLLVGFVLLIKGADFFVDGSSSIATMLHVPALIIGLTLVAMGTSLPELSVSLVASINNSNSLAISNAVGSNIFNFLVVLGVAAMLQPLKVEEDVLRRDFPFSIICGVFLVVEGIIFSSMARVFGVLHLVVFTCYIIMVTVSAVRSRRIETELQDVSDKKALLDDELDTEAKEISLPLWKSLIFVVGGVLAIKIGGDWVVESATDIAVFFGVSETLIGLTIVSVGTSLPELVTSVVAAKKGQMEMAIGNAVGSNIFNILLILGVASAISPIAMISENIIDAGFLVLVSIIGFVFCKTRKTLCRIEGCIMVAIYIGYMAYVLMR